MTSDWYDVTLVREISSRLQELSERDQVIVLRGVSWEQYDALDESRGEASQPRLAYLDGSLEIMTTGRPHEYEKTMIARLVEAFAEEAGVELNGFGNETYRRKPKAAGLEPDECYCIDAEKEIPDLAIEVVHSSGGIDKLEVYRRLGVREVWFFIAGAFEVFRLRGGVYRRARKSFALRGIDLHEVARIVRTIDRAKQTRAVRAYRKALQRRFTQSDG